MKIEYYEDMLEEVAINKYLNMIANDYNGELAKTFQEKYINKEKEIERLNNIIKEVREYIEKNWISQKDADNYRFDDAELIIEISDTADLFDILDKGKE